MTLRSWWRAAVEMGEGTATYGEEALPHGGGEAPAHAAGAAAGAHPWSAQAGRGSGQPALWKVSLRMARGWN